MKTFDGAKLALDRLAKSLATYPEGSVTPRTVVTTIPCGDNPEDVFQKINAAVTTQLFKSASAVHDNRSLLRRVKMTDEEVEASTTEIVTVANAAINS